MMFFKEVVFEPKTKKKLGDEEVPDLKNNFPKLPSLKTLIDRLPSIFPEGTENRNYLIREMAAKTIFVMFYAGAIEGTNIWIRPDQVTKMTDAQVEKNSDSDRLEWAKASLEPGKMKDIPGRWYSVNTREPIRDETLRSLILTGAILERKDLPTTSAKPRYALRTDFAKLFDESISAKELEKHIDEWQSVNLSSEAFARIKLVRRGATAAEKTSHVLVKFPNGEIRRMSPGPSSMLSKAVIEIFARRFLGEPAVVFLSESSDKIVVQDHEIARSIGLHIEADRNLPDIILVDLSLEQPILVFVEVVVTDGPVSKSRKDALLNIAINGGFKKENVVFLTAFRDRGEQAYRRLSSDLAWGSFVWFASEPEFIMILKDKEELTSKKIADLL